MMTQHQQQAVAKSPGVRFGSPLPDLLSRCWRYQSKAAARQFDLTSTDPTQASSEADDILKEKEDSLIKDDEVNLSLIIDQLADTSNSDDKLCQWLEAELIPSAPFLAPSRHAVLIGTVFGWSFLRPSGTSARDLHTSPAAPLSRSKQFCQLYAKFLVELARVNATLRTGIVHLLLDHFDKLFDHHWCLPTCDDATQDTSTVGVFQTCQPALDFVHKCLGEVTSLEATTQPAVARQRVLSRLEFPFWFHPADKHICYLSNILRLAQGEWSDSGLRLYTLCVEHILSLDLRCGVKVIQEWRQEKDKEAAADSSSGLFPMDPVTTSSPPSSVEWGQTPPAGRTLDCLLSMLLVCLTNQARRGQPLLIRKGPASQNHSEPSDLTPLLSWFSCHTFVSSSSNLTPSTGQLKQQKPSRPLKALFRIFLTIFDKLLLNTHGSSHVQFILLYIISLHPTLVDAFVDYLMKLTTSQSASNLKKQMAFWYLGSLISHCNFLDPALNIVKSVLQTMADWISNYIDKTHGIVWTGILDANTHGPFYVACQTLMSVIIYRQDMLFDQSLPEATLVKNLAFVSRLKLMKMIECNLNPLKVCLPTVVQAFARLMQTHQIIYCYEIMERNRRTNFSAAPNPEALIQDPKTRLDPEDCFDPFHSYYLPRSGADFLFNLIAQSEERILYFAVPSETILNKNGTVALEDQDLIEMQLYRDSGDEGEAVDDKMALSLRDNVGLAVDRKRWNGGNKDTAESNPHGIGLNQTGHSSAPHSVGLQVVPWSNTQHSAVLSVIDSEMLSVSE